MGLRVNPKFVAPVLAVIYRVWFRTLRFTVINRKHFDRGRKDARRLVIALWHDELFPMPGYNRSCKLKLAIVVSQSRDGELIARMLESLGFRTARGSSTRGGLRALVEVRRLMRDEHMDVAITVDGPRGPRHEVKEGAVYLAARTGSLIQPVRAVCNRAKRFKSWDRFQMPWPFSHVQLIFGEPYAIETSEAGDADEALLKRETARLKEKLDALA